MPPRPAVRRLAPPVLLLAALLALTGCQTYTDRTEGRDQAMRSGNIAAALARADKDVAKNQDNKDAVLFRLEQGAILRAAALADLPLAPAIAPAPLPAGEIAAPPATARAAYLARSVAAFDDAARRIDAYDAAAKIRVGAEAGALLTNQANIPYRGRAYDKVMLHTYQALNYLQLANADAARVELNRAFQAQRDAVAANAKRIDEAQKLAAEAEAGGVQDEQGRQGQSYDVDRAQSDPRTAAGIAGIETKFNSAILPYGDYVNPFTTFLDALVFTHQAADASDLERARKSWERVVNFAPGNPYAREDYIAAEPDLQPAARGASADVASPEGDVARAVPVAAAVPADTPVEPAAPPQLVTPPPPGAITYVIFETGTAPYREQLRIDIPIFVFTDRLSYVGAAFPRIETVGGHAERLQVRDSAGASRTTALVASMDSVVAQDFKNEWPSILTKTLISTATKATIDAVLQKQIQDQAGSTGALLFQLATAVTQMAINIADTRTWRSLPKEFQYARLPTPADRRLTLYAGGLATTVELEPAAVSVVYVKSTSSFSPLLVGQFILKK